MKKFIPLIVLAVIAFLGVGLFVGKAPQPEIVVPAEKLWALGPLNITNTLFTSWIVIILLIVVSFAATRTMRLVPSGLQNFMEAVVGFLLAQMEEIAGEKRARHFFMVVATIFLFVITSNWFGLFPFFNAIGKTEDVGHEIFVELAEEHPADLKLGPNGTYTESHKFAGTKMSDSSLSTVAIGESSYEYTVKTGDTPESAFNRYVVFLAKTFAGYKISADELEAASAESLAARVKDAKAALDATPSAPKLITDEAAVAGYGHDEPLVVNSKALAQPIYGVDFSNSKKLALVIPAFRGVFSDVNNTLALGFVAFFMIEFWGFQALGFGYLKKFFNLNGIMSFVGILELLSELIRIISFAFRLFGNIFAGEVLVLMLTFLMPFLLVDIIYGLELFVGFIQAAVFALLTLVFGVMATEHHGDEEHHEGHGGDASPDAHHNVGAAQAH